jgi:two-component system response regulator
MQRESTDILLIEDNPDDVALTLHAFRSVHLMNNVHVARDGAEALEWVFGTGVGPGDVAAPRVILLDLKLPLVDGLEVLRQLKADPRTRMIPVVVLTSSQEERDLIASYQLGVSSYIVKPVDFEQFTTAMQTLGTYWLVLNQPVPEHALPDQDVPA